MAHLLVKLGHQRFPIGRNRFHQGKNIGHADVIDAAGVNIRCERQPGQHCVAAVAAAINRYPFWVSDSLLNQPFDAIGDVILHLPAPLFEPGFPECPAVTGRSPVVHLKHGKSPVGQ